MDEGEEVRLANYLSNVTTKIIYFDFLWCSNKGICELHEAQNDDACIHPEMVIKAKLG